MNISITLNDDEAALVSEYAAKSQVSVSEFAREATTKAARNAAYLAKLAHADEQIREGKIVTFTSEEWENFINEQDLH